MPTNIVVITCLLSLVALFGSPGNTASAESIRRSPLAGAWYPADAQALRTMLENYLAAAGPSTPPGTAPTNVSSPVLGIISPHAGYVYSGRAAAYGFNTLKGTSYNRVILLGPSHYARLHGVCISSYDAYETPLGKVPVDESASKELSKHPLFQRHRKAEAQEHSLEMQLPFLQMVLKDFTIVPLIIGDLREPEYTQAADQLRPFLNERTLIVASSDFTHYGQRFGYVPFTDNIKENLRNLDQGATAPILNKDFAVFNRYVEKTGITICGRRPISVLLKLLPEAASGEMLAYYTSGDLSGDYSSTVSYVSIVFRKSDPPASGNPAGEKQPLPRPGRAW